MSGRMRVLLIAVAVIFLVGVAGSFFVRNSPHSQLVQVVQDGKALYTFDLSNQKESESTDNVSENAARKTVFYSSNPRCHWYAGIHALSVGGRYSGRTILGWYSYRLGMMDLVRGLGKTVLAALHDLNIAAAYCDWRYALQDGRHRMIRRDTAGRIQRNRAGVSWHTTLPRKV